MSSEIQLLLKNVGEINGRFYIPDYQRGYRWGTEEVERLLDDIYSNATNNYCLQPIVVRRLSKEDIEKKQLESSDWSELIDGQQRLTTLYLIYCYMHNKCDIPEPKFSLAYETRKGSEAYLRDIDPDQRGDNIDYWFIYNAYETIDNWFKKQDNAQQVMSDINKRLNENVQVIWYEVGPDEDAIALFTRLNIGKIPLTSAELVKAIFLSEDSGMKMEVEKPGEIALQWDNIENELHEDSFWYFLSNLIGVSYQTRINLILDLITEKPIDSMDSYYSFFRFDQMRKEESLDILWQKIQHTFLTLKGWYESHQLYHKIGYLIASEYKEITLQSIYSLSQQTSKAQFMDMLDNTIRSSIDINGNYAELSYDKAGDHQKIYRLLLLFNVISVMKHDGNSQRFPFDKLKYSDQKKVVWSLEHIHAQQSEKLKAIESRQWLVMHRSSIAAIDKQSSLLTEIDTLLSKPQIENEAFDNLQEKIFERLSTQGSTEYMHSIANLALLNIRDNAALSNSTFDVKRNEIIKIDRAGEYIPFCTRMVFLKYYTPSEDNQLHFWGQADRVAYIKAINEVLKEYLGNNLIDMEEA